MKYITHVCGDADVNKTAELRNRKYSTYNYVKYIILDNYNKPLCHWFRYLLYYVSFSIT